MLFSRVAAFFVGAVAFAMPVVAAPQPVAEIEKRAVGITDLTNILNELTANVQPLLPQITQLGQNGSATLANATPLINQLVSELNAAHSKISALPPSSFKLMKRQDLTAVAGILSPLLTEITLALNALLSAGVVALNTLIPLVDLALQQLLSIIGFLVPGILAIVGNLVGTVVGVVELLLSLLPLVVGILGIL